MLFNSLQYMIFLPIVFALYWALPHKFRMPLILVASYYFYISLKPAYVFILLFTTLISFVGALLMEKSAQKSSKKCIFILCVILCLLALFFFKYFNFTFETLSRIANRIAVPLSPVVIKLALPVGISFYTFKTLSYLIDVYKEAVPAERNFFAYASYVSFFPELIAGPIDKSANLLTQLKSPHSFQESKATEGAKLMLWGYFKKLVIADFLAQYVDKVYENLPAFSGIDLLFVSLFFTIQIYCDFSGYSDITIGTAKLLDIDLATNFKSPYFSSSVKEFWSRWHISLSTWFRDYVYIPLGGNRCSKLRHFFNLLVTFLVSGLWHGANWTFIVWGSIHGLMQIIENAFAKSLKTLRSCKIGKILCTVFVFLFCNLAWIFFRADSFADAFYVMTGMTQNMLHPALYFQSDLLGIVKLLAILLLLLILAGYDYIDYKIGFDKWLGQRNRIVSFSFYILLGLLILFCSKKGVAADFVYLQF